MQNKIKHNLQNVQSSLLKSPPTRLIAVTKYASLDQIQCLINLGITLLGENKVQDAIKKIEHFSNPSLEWHLIGHLQTNKVKQAVRYFSCIQSVDSLKLLEKIDIEAGIQHKKMPILIQLNLANDPNKFGFELEDFEKNKIFIFSLLNLEIQGIMIIVPYSDNLEEVRVYFKKAAELYRTLQQEYASISTLSMGMSHDYLVAQDEGANLIRIGSLLFQ